MKKLHLTTIKGTRQNIGSKKHFINEEKMDLATNAEKMALKAQEKIKGKTMVEHPALKNTWIYK